jgi:hypothetical protein
MAQQAISELLENNRLLSFNTPIRFWRTFRTWESIAAELPLTSQANTGLARTERRELVLVKANSDHGWPAFGDALPGKKHRENIRGRANRAPEKDN